MSEKKCIVGSLPPTGWATRIGLILNPPYKSLTEALQCRDVLEKELGRPLHLHSHIVEPFKPAQYDHREHYTSEGMSIHNYSVEENDAHTQCHEGATYKDPWPKPTADSFIDLAKECAKSLTRIAGTAYESTLIEKRFMLPDVYQVIKVAK